MMVVVVVVATGAPLDSTWAHPQAVKSKYEREERRREDEFIDSIVMFFEKIVKIGTCRRPTGQLPTEATTEKDNTMIRKQKLFVACGFAKGGCFDGNENA